MSQAHEQGEDTHSSDQCVVGVASVVGVALVLARNSDAGGAMLHVLQVHAAI